MSNHALVHTHSIMYIRTYHSITHCSSQSEVKPTLVHEVPHHWDTTTCNCIVKACRTILIHCKCTVSKEGQQVLEALNGSTIGSKVEGSDRILCTWLVSLVECCIRLRVPLSSVTHFCLMKYICSVFQQHLHHRKVPSPCSIQYCCC